MKKYKVNVNGTSYEITLEVMDAPATANNAAPAAAPAPAAVPAASASGEAVKAPMPGTILAVNVSAGASVKKGDVLMILEPMKMENEILAAHDGTIGAVSVAKGAAVKSGDVLCTFA